MWRKGRADTRRTTVEDFITAAVGAWENATIHWSKIVNNRTNVLIGCEFTDISNSVRIHVSRGMAARNALEGTSVQKTG